MNVRMFRLWVKQGVWSKWPPNMSTLRMDATCLQKACHAEPLVLSAEGREVIHEDL